MCIKGFAVIGDTIGDTIGDKKRLIGDTIGDKKGGLVTKLVTKPRIGDMIGDRLVTSTTMNLARG